MEPTCIFAPPAHDVGVDDDDSVIYDITSEEFSTDEFRMYDFKVRRCPKQKPHDWTQCPFAHCGERATRRDPRLFNYSGAACGEFRRTGTCSRGDLCPYAHGVFESWLHPSKYKTQMCSDVKFCKRPVCFFAHSPSELRTPTGVPKGLHIQKPFHRDLPALKQSNHGVNVEAIAAEVEKLLGQKANVPPSMPHGNYITATAQDSSQNAISSFLSSVVQLQHAVPGINVMHLLQTMSGSQQGPQIEPSSVQGMNRGKGGGDLNSALAQMQLGLQNQMHTLQAPVSHAQMPSEFVRHQSWSSNRTLPSAMSMDAAVPLPGPMTSYENTLSPRATSMNAFSGPFSTRNSVSSACSLPVIPTTGGTHPQMPTSSGIGIGTSGLFNQHARGDIPVDWAAVDHDAGKLGSNGSDLSTAAGDTQAPERTDSALWSCEEWLPLQHTTAPITERRAGQIAGNKSSLKCADEIVGLKCMDPLLDALPSDLQGA